MRQIVVYGNSFAALHAVRELQSALDGRTRLELLLVAPRGPFLYTPLLPHVASGALPKEALTFPVSDVLHPSTNLVRATSRGIDLTAREVVTADRRIPFDYLVFAPRAVPDWGGCRPAANACAAWSLEGASQLQSYIQERARNGVDDRVSSSESKRPLAIVGGGPAAVEIASELRRGAHHRTDREEPGAHSTAADLPICVIEREPSLLPEAPAPLRRACRAHFRSADIQWTTDTRVAACHESSLEFERGSTLEVDAAAHCTGMSPPESVAQSPFPVDERGRIEVHSTLRVPEAPGIYVAGDAARAPDSLPLRAHLAAAQGSRAAQNVRADLSGRTLRSWSPDDDSWLLTLGSSGAAVFNGESLMTGQSARVLYRLRHASWMPAPLAESGRAQKWLEEGPTAGDP